MVATVPITVVIPVGPLEVHRRWLGECLASILDQNPRPAEILIVDDYNGLPDLDIVPPVRVHRNPWRLGCADSWNIGVALAANDLAFLMGADDKLLPDCLAYCWAEWESVKDPHGYYWVPVEYSTGETQNCCCNAAMVCKGLWKLNGGFPPEAAVGQPDSIFISMMLAHMGPAGNFYHVEAGKPLYWWRRHQDQDTVTRREWKPVIDQAIDVFTRTWQRPKWTHYQPDAGVSRVGVAD